MIDAPRKQPRRPHFLKEWTETRGLSQTELAREIGANKGVVSRWYAGAAPSDNYQKKLAAFFGCERDSLFCHPDEYWLAQFMRGRSPEEIAKIKATLTAAFPR